MARNPDNPNFVNSLNLSMRELNHILIEITRSWEYNSKTAGGQTAYDKIKNFLDNEYVVLTNDVE